jgi:hypothetical protein
MGNLKKAQADIIVTVLLILIGIAAVSLISYFVVGFVRNNLTNTDCVNTAGQLKISLEDDLTSYRKATGELYVVIERTGEKAFNFTNLIFVYGTSQSTKSLNYAENLDMVYYYDLDSGEWKNDKVELPESAGERRTYKILLAELGEIPEVDNLAIAPIINKDQKCSEADKKPVKIISSGGAPL